ncbi:(2Fe-2S)-binding protein [Streptomyces sp. NPDC049954]|uniref:(2Fe-2S)-binding protein n=1 Tax=Streptomyces sp. NPDC049954 TaxID=3155779 RepID=UPI00343492D7
MREIMERLARIGPYFTAECGEPKDAAGFAPLSTLYDSGLEEYVARTAPRMGTADRRVAASTVHLGLVSRLWSLGLGAAALDGRVPDLAPGRVRWRLSGDGALTLWLPEPLARPEAPAEALRATVVEANLRPLGTAMRTRLGLSAPILRGNAASALVGTLRVLLGRVPDAPHPPVPTAAALLGRAPLSEGGTFLHEEGLGVAFLRSSCCLYYRVPGGGLCGDCVLRSAPARRG